MTTCAVLVPVLDRPHRVKPLVDSLQASRHRSCTVWPIFICSPSDHAEIAAVKAQPDVGLMVVDWEPGRGDWAKKLNYAFRHTQSDWVLLGADDIVFREGWMQNALHIHEEYHPCVIGTNDLGNPRVTSGHHSVHPLVHRAYAECGTIDDETVLLHEGYWHNFVDDEFVGTARYRQTYAPAVDSHIEHLHPNWGKGEMDATYARGQARFDIDRAHFQTREHLWGRA